MNTPPSIYIYIYVDVDDTFVRSASTKRIPMPAIISHIRSLHEQGAILYCWSAGGAAYAKRSAEEFDLADCFEAFLPKPNVFIDDVNPAEWPRSFTAHPATCANNSLDDYHRELK